MTTLAIIGSGIAGRSLIYTLAKERKEFKEIVIFESESFLKACSYRSTAVVAGRGLSLGHSSLGDTLYESFQFFQKHFREDSPEGVQKVLQVSGASKKLAEFQIRYPSGIPTDEYTKEKMYSQKDEAFLIDPKTYLDFLLRTAKDFYKGNLLTLEDLVIEVNPDGKIRTQKGREFRFDKVVFAGGVYNRFWSPQAPESKLKTIKASQGSYVEFSLPKKESPSLSLTLDGHNFIWNDSTKKLLIGSTTLEVPHEIHPKEALEEVYRYFQEKLEEDLPDFSEGMIRIGLREKAQKRSPYFFSVGKLAYMGGFYKNGYTLGMTISSSLSRHFL